MVVHGYNATHQVFSILICCLHTIQLTSTDGTKSTLKYYRKLLFSLGKDTDTTVIQVARSCYKNAIQQIAPAPW